MIYPIRRIVAGVAGLEADDPVLVGSLEIAERTGAVLHVVHTFELPSLDWDAYGRMGFVDPEDIQRYADSLVADLKKAVATHGRDVRVQYHAIAAPPAASIRDVVERHEADLIVVGATRHGALTRALLGTTAQRVVRQARTPVLVLRQSLRWPIERVLLTTELGPFSAGVHELGLDVLETLWGDSRPDVRSLLVVGPVLPLPSPLSNEQVEDIAHDQLGKFLRDRRERTAEVVGTVRIGEAAAEIAKEADEWSPDLLLVGTHARKTVERWLMGSVAEAALREVRTNVLVIPARAEEQRNLPVAQGSKSGNLPVADTPAS
jgi:nucleotide-binding universal stress UspA family protein